MRHVNKMKVSSKIFRGPGFDHTIYIGVYFRKRYTSPPTMNIICNKLKASWANKATLVKNSIH